MVYQSYYDEMIKYLSLCDDIYIIEMKLKRGLVCYVPRPNYPTPIGWTDETTLFYTSSADKQNAYKNTQKDKERLSHLLRKREIMRLEINTIYGQSSLNYS